MANAWFRLYAEFATDPKIQRLSEAFQRRFIMLLCMQCSNGNVTLQDEDVTFQLRISNENWAETKAVFIEKNMIDQDNKIINWEKRQFISDSSAARVRRHREARKEKVKQECNVSVTPQNRTEQNRTDQKKHIVESPKNVTPESQTQKKLISVAGKPDTPDAAPNIFVLSTEPHAEHFSQRYAADVREVFDFWREALKHPSAQLDENRQRFLRNALKKYSVEQCKQAIIGCSLTPHNMGQNERGEQYHGISVIFKNADNIDRFIANAQAPPKPVQKKITKIAHDAWTNFFNEAKRCGWDSQKIKFEDPKILIAINKIGGIKQISMTQDAQIYQKKNQFIELYQSLGP